MRKVCGITLSMVVAGSVWVVNGAWASEAGQPNRLADESSPYLQLHAYNPVDWYPWGEEALARAREEDKPIFLSVGYSTCYWCHVMERRVFSDPAIAELMNRWFINIKVDREERPDIDEIYMTTTQLLTQHGGWPNSVFMTPDLRPFYAGTYFPPEDQSGRPGFPTVLRALHQAWGEKRSEVETQADRIAEALGQVLSAQQYPAGSGLPAAAASSVVEGLKQRYDADFGGFGREPKFPSPASLHLLWYQAESGDRQSRDMVLESLRNMGRGAIYDQLAGGFHRYTLDRAWRIPHFEKMLYDNALLGEIFAVVAAATGDPELARLARGTLDFVLSTMRLPNGAFVSAIDAETDGVEGAFYVWSREELEGVLGTEEAQFLGPILGFEDPPNVEGNRHTLYLTDSLAGHARRLGMTTKDLLGRFDTLLAKLESHRAQRPFPLVDDKILTDWNGMAIGALARAGRLLPEDRYLDAAIKAADFVLAQRGQDGLQLHVWRDGVARLPAFLDDYAFLIRGLLNLFESTEQTRWLEEAERLTVEMERQLREPRGGYFTGPQDPTLLVRARTASGGAIPAGNGVAIANLLRLAELTGRPLYRARATTAIGAFAAELEQVQTGMPAVALAVLMARDMAPGTADGPTTADPVTDLAHQIVEAELNRAPRPGGSAWSPFTVELRIRAGWHLNANPASSDLLIPTSVDGEVRSLAYPAGDKLHLAFAGEELSVFTDSVSIRGEMAADAATVRLEYQACDDRRCLPPVSRELPVRKPTSDDR